MPDEIMCLGLNAVMAKNPCNSHVHIKSKNRHESIHIVLFCRVGLGHVRLVRQLFVSI